jgi:dolichyl-phosphate-mannose-protein mannosyltransferase
MARVTTTTGRDLEDGLDPRPAPAAPADERTITVGRDSEGLRIPPLRDRLSPPMPTDRVIGWIAPLLITALAGFFRFWQLGKPAKFVFDETYYPKDAWSLLNFGVEHQFVEKANDLIVGGNLNVFVSPAQPSFVVHPPAGKWLIALGEWAFGMNPFGWRVAIAVVGTLSILLMARLVRRLTRSTLLGCVAALLLALDGLHLVESRIALLDLPVMFWLLLGLSTLLIDRDWMRRKLADAAEPLGRIAPGAWGPRLLWRPWRLAAGLCFGLAIATKWSAIIPLAMFGLITVWWDWGARRAVRSTLFRVGTFFRAILDAFVAFVTIVVTAALVYVASWSGWLATSTGYDRNWAEGKRPRIGDLALANPVPGLFDPLRSLWHYHQEIWTFHTTLDDKHQYQSSPWSWLVVGRPVSFDWVDNIGPNKGCSTSRCVQEILGIGTPILWWGAVIALLACVVFWLAGRDWRFGIPVLGVAATWLPWFQYDDRPIFYFYAIVILPFLVIGVTLVLGKILGPPEAPPNRRMWGAALVGGFVLLVALNFAYLFPILTDQTITYAEWLSRMWLKTWV